jgi:hypothetical protein
MMQIHGDDLIAQEPWPATSLDGTESEEGLTLSCLQIMPWMEPCHQTLLNLSATWLASLSISERHCLFYVIGNVT